MEYLHDLISSSQRLSNYWNRNTGISPLAASELAPMTTGSSTVTDRVVDLIGHKPDPTQEVVIYIDQNPSPEASIETKTFFPISTKVLRLYSLFLKSNVLLLEKFSGQYATMVPETWDFESEFSYWGDRVLPMKASATKIFEFQLSVKIKELPQLQHKFFLDPLLN